jgi:hypothetical protein
VAEEGSSPGGWVGRFPASPGLWAVRGEHLAAVLDLWRATWAECRALGEEAVWTRVAPSTAHAGSNGGTGKPLDAVPADLQSSVPACAIDPDLAWQLTRFGCPSLIRACRQTGSGT